MEFVASLGVAGTLGWRAVAFAAGDLDDDVIFEEEVDPGVRPTVAAMDHLGLRPRQPGLAYKVKEPAFEQRVPAGIDEQVVEESGAPATRTPQRTESIDQDDW